MALAEAETLLALLGRRAAGAGCRAPQERIQEAYQAAHTSRAGARAACSAAREIALAMERLLDGLRFGRVTASAEVIDAWPRASMGRRRGAMRWRALDRAARAHAGAAGGGAVPRRGTVAASSVGARTSAGVRGRNRADPTTVMPLGMRAALTRRAVAGPCGGAQRSRPGVRAGGAALGVVRRELGELRTALRAMESSSPV